MPAKSVWSPCIDDFLASAPQHLLFFWPKPGGLSCRSSPRVRFPPTSLASWAHWHPVIVILNRRGLLELDRPLDGSKKYGFLGFLTRARWGSGGPREAPQSPPWAFPGPPGASRRSPGPKTNQIKKPRNPKNKALFKVGLVLSRALFKVGI